MKKVFLDGLPNRGKYIDWKNSIGYKIPFVYNDIEDKIEIINYDKSVLTIKYKDKILDMKTDKFSKCQLAKILMKRTNKFKVNIGTSLKDNKRNMTVIDKKYKETTRLKKYKYYKYKCNKCNNIDWIEESKLLKGQSCNVCSNSKAKLGFNTIWDKARWMCDLGVSEGDAKRYTPNSNKRINVICPDCGREKSIIINNIYRNRSISCLCNDKKPYPEKFVFNVLEQLNIDFETEYSPEWANNGKQRRYDFYLKHNNEKFIIETHGEQHYKASHRGRTLKEEKENDSYKKYIALQNGIKHYISLDCRKSELDWIKNSILKSELSNILDLSKVDWIKSEEYVLRNIAKEVCEYWKSKKDSETTTDLAKVFKLDKSTILKYLKKGTKLDWCIYDSKEEVRVNGVKSGKRFSKPLEVFNKYGESMGIFDNCYELERQSEDIFKTKLYQSSTSGICRGEKLTYKGYTFKYVNT